MKYRKCRKYKYVLVEDIGYYIDIGVIYESDFLRLAAGTLHIKAGYAWDGPSGPTIDTKNFMRGSLVHDALYQLHREGVLDCRMKCDKILRQICIEDGMSALRAWWVYRGVRLGGSRSVEPTTLEAP